MIIDANERTPLPCGCLHWECIPRDASGDEVPDVSKVDLRSGTAYRRSIMPRRHRGPRDLGPLLLLPGTVRVFCKHGEVFSDPPHTSISVVGLDASGNPWMASYTPNAVVATLPS